MTNGMLSEIVPEWKENVIFLLLILVKALTITLCVTALNIRNSKSLLFWFIYCQLWIFFLIYSVIEDMLGQFHLDITSKMFYSYKKTYQILMANIFRFYRLIFLCSEIFTCSKMQKMLNIKRVLFLWVGWKRKDGLRPICCSFICRVATWGRSSGIENKSGNSAPNCLDLWLKKVIVVLKDQLQACDF